MLLVQETPKDPTYLSLKNVYYPIRYVQDTSTKPPHIDTKTHRRVLLAIPSKKFSDVAKILAAPESEKIVNISFDMCVRFHELLLLIYVVLTEDIDRDDDLQ